ncbi:mannitol dehydrogenase family protein [Cocleimonas sp. KMM 6892]|uniref:D-arabinitol 4-dehydrogenase n=1 Tax=unclassified Cocleimonas TaxID=2639732 RepID=UPI002DB894E4|nr:MULTISPECIES: D-arabinitol 4-dehydrogenase [unclassified Cocleimonas]MEB8432771.1 mannitol dehydrogenase family protein [Cocleimonas sp. KMM 6892]MEC4715630.1 mannitol dehydrogenase family protein [Cocleimonas sp. KMM 6895]MEC4744752.1 mannitol dehydrogenase family protein [Cocleimonas sp. KMM 6896]
MKNSGNSDTSIQLHLGLGSFHRAHQAMYMQNLHDIGETQWEIAAGNIRSDMQSVVEILKSQNNEYMLETVSPAGEHKYQLIQSIKHIVDWEKDMKGITEIAANENTKIISFTVTEAGYYLDGNFKLDDSYKDLQSDLAGNAPCTIYGTMTQLLRARMASHVEPVTLLNCDNVRSNGEKFKNALLEYIERIGDTDLLEWVKTHTSSPNSMVDRITPRPTADIIERVFAATDRRDEAALMGESFTQWVIEDNFIAGRPPWELVDVEMVEDVEPYEEAKIRVLNATHSCIAWAGTLRGYQYIHQGTNDPEVRQLAFDYVTNDVIPCLTSAESPSPIDLDKYRDTVLERFSNPNILDTNQRVVMDAYSKIPSFILPTIQDAIKAGRSIDSVAMLPALFLAFLVREQKGEIKFEYEDAMMSAENAQKIVSSDDIVHAFSNDKILFGDLAGNQTLRETLRKAYDRVNAFIEKTA